VKFTFGRQGTLTPLSALKKKGAGGFRRREGTREMRSSESGNS
jgi:hypothetical protein